MAVSYVIRLKESWKPKVDRITRGQLTTTFAKGSDLDLLLEQEVLQLDGKVIDAQVRVGSGTKEHTCRLVAVPTPKGYCFYLTNLPRTIGSRQIADLYRVRWKIETDNKLDKSCLNLDKITARTGPAVRALIDASLVGSIIVGLLAHHHRARETKQSGHGKKSSAYSPTDTCTRNGLRGSGDCLGDGIERTRGKRAMARAGGIYGALG